MANTRESKRHHFTYKTTNLVNGRYYLGMHSTNKLSDGYLGSGKRLYYELNKYGKENFKLEILEQFNSREELVQAEINLITEEDLKNTNCLNCKPGGEGGFTEKARSKGASQAGKKHSQRMKTDPLYRQTVLLKMSEGLKEAYRTGKKKKNHTGWTAGKYLTEEHKKKIGEANKNKQKGNNNSQYGTCWITDGKFNKKVKKTDVLPEGWQLGRVLK